MTMVSIIMMTYRHQKYIAQAIQGVLMQIRDFELEIIVANDNSPDKTEEIVEEYRRRYPNIVKGYCNKENIGPQANYAKAFNLSRGKYIAVCEGDDFWTDPNKLSLQVKLLEGNSDAVGCFHDVRVIKEDGREIPSYYPIPPRQKLTTVEMLWKHYIPTCSYVYRKKSFNADYFTITDNLISGDRYLELYNTFFGYIEYIPKVMASHIKHELGLSTSSSLRAYKYRVNNFIALYKGLASDARRLKKNEKLFYPKLSTSYAYGTISHIKHFQLVHALRYSMLSVKYLLAAPTEFIKQKLLKKY